MNLMAAHNTVTSVPKLYAIFKERLTPADKFGHLAAASVYYTHIEGNATYTEIYNDFVGNQLKHNKYSLQVKELIDKLGYKCFVKAFDLVIKLEYEGKTENFPKGKY